MFKLMQSCCVLLLLCSSMAALPGSPADTGKHKPPRVTLNENDTPLDKMIEKAKKDIADKVAAQKELERQQGKTDCADADSLPNEDIDKPGKKAKACKVMQFKGPEKVKDPVEIKKDAHGNVVGKKVKTRTKLVFDHPNQRGLNRWDDSSELKYQGRPSLEFAGVPPGQQAANLRIRTARLPASEGINNDRDCIDSASGERLGGYVLDDQGQQVPNPNSCFETDGTLKKTLTLLTDQSGQCAHANGTVYSAQECQELNLTTLEELIDEDSPNEPGGPPVDGDQDGNVEDVPELGTSNPCTQNGGVVTPGNAADSCDFTQAVRRKANQAALEELPQGKKKKLFKINDTTGECDPNAEGEYPCGEEPREVELEETMELSCPPGGILEDDRCLIPPRRPDRGFAALAAGRPLTPTSAGASQTDYAMMGFTFAPPVLKWGINEVQRVCIFGWCFEIFALRFGYEFEIAAGLRLPVKVTVTDIPSPHVVAEQSATLAATLEPADFRVSDFTSFCLKHDLDRSWYISDCNRFAFPEYFESMLPDSWFSPPGNRQGQEFVAQTTAFAGLQVRVFSIPIVNYAIDSSVNVPAMCTLYKMKQQIADGGVADWIRLAASFGQNFQESKDFMASLEGTLTNCASFTTPWGKDDKGEWRQFPFLTGTFAIPADCTREKLEAVAVGGQGKPMCTGLKVNIYGATLGLGLEFAPLATSDLITSKATTAGDAQALDQELRFEWGKDGPAIGPVRFDNYDNAADTATVRLDDFVYYLNTFGVQVNGLIELGGILAFIGNVASVPLVNLTFDLDDHGIPIPQHPGTGPLAIDVPVANYAVTVDARTRADDPMRVSDDTLRVKPGTSGFFEVWVKNEGSVPDSFDNFTYALSNRPDQVGAYVFGINPNTDFDCVDSGGNHYRGYPYDGIPDDCYDAAGNVLPGRTELIDEDPAGPGTGDVASRDSDHDGAADEDPVDVWVAALGSSSVPNVDAHSVAATPVLLEVVPFRHALTKPGDYPVRVTVDSHGARTLQLAATDPSNLPRLGAEDVVKIRIESFFEPLLTVAPAESSVKPGGWVSYAVEAANGGNDLDQLAVTASFPDSDTAACSLTRNGQGPECPYRALITRIDPVTWTTVADLDALFPLTGFFQPLGSSRDSFTIGAPLDWAGMQDTVYEFTLTATSTADPAIQKAKSAKTMRFYVLATKESMSRYVNLEVAEFLEQITQADAQGIAMRGIKPVMMYPVSMMTTKALEQILAGDLEGASKSLASGIKVMEAVARMVDGAGLPPLLADDWKARSAAILADMAAAQASMVASR